MKNTKSALLLIAITFISCAVFAAWVEFCWQISNGSAWGLALALSALAVPVVAVAIYKDLR